MNTISKALGLLEHFTLSQKSWGLSELARAANHDKATTLRLLRGLMAHAMIEQDPVSRKYQLGTAFLTLARVREASFPLATVLQENMRELADAVGETTHAAVGAEAFLRTVAVIEPQRATRVHLDPADRLPLHATASGIVYLAFGPAAALRGLTREISLPAFTSRTATTAKAVQALVDEARQQGYALANQTFEDETTGIAVPFFDETAIARGAIAVATPTLRLDTAAQHRITEALFAASRRVTDAIGGELPHGFG